MDDKIKKILYLAALAFADYIAYDNTKEVDEAIEEAERNFDRMERFLDDHDEMFLHELIDALYQKEFD